ncbi:MAG: isocitrate lyase/PEP mutase family protein [Paracoccaceae bacterium]|nr:isocitrate lyase/PEP mutase family protein [Paracoccaceae bacterium]
MTLTPRQWFAQALASGDLIQAPGVYDGIMARLVQQAGFKAAYMTGAGTAISNGLPDYGLMTMTEMVANAARIAQAAEIAVIADADTGFGNELNVTRAVREYERAGVVAIHIEDQGFPKKCGHLDDKEIVPMPDFTAKIRAAVAARKDPDFKIIARTDARAPVGFDEAIKRANAAMAAGADIAFVEAPQTMEELAAVPKLVDGPCVFNLVYGGKTPVVSLDQIAEMGFRLAIMPDVLWREIVMVCEKTLAVIAQGELPDQTTGLKVKDLFARAGADEWDALRTRFADPNQQAAE